MNFIALDQCLLESDVSPSIWLWISSSLPVSWYLIHIVRILCWKARPGDVPRGGDLGEGLGFLDLVTSNVAWKDTSSFFQLHCLARSTQSPYDNARNGPLNFATTPLFTPNWTDNC